MTQVASTIRTFEASGKPAVEAHLSHPELGDVRLVVAGRAGEVIQAELIVRDRAAADALTHAAVRFDSGDALSGVNLIVRTDSGDASFRGLGQRHGQGWTGEQSGGRNAETFASLAGSGGGAGSSGNTAANGGSSFSSDGGQDGLPWRPAPPLPTPHAGGASTTRRTPGLTSSKLDVRA